MHLGQIREHSPAHPGVRAAVFLHCLSKKSHYHFQSSKHEWKHNWKQQLFYYNYDLRLNFKLQKFGQSKSKYLMCNDWGTKSSKYISLILQNDEQKVSGKQYYTKFWLPPFSWMSQEAYQVTLITVTAKGTKTKTVVSASAWKLNRKQTLKGWLWPRWGGRGFSRWIFGYRWAAKGLKPWSC